jgi:hypothetical protein
VVAPPASEWGDEEDAGDPRHGKGHTGKGRGHWKDKGDRGKERRDDRKDERGPGRDGDD